MLRRSSWERDEWASDLLDRLTPVMSALGIIFLLVVLGEQLAQTGSMTADALRLVGWALWGAFVAEFVARLVVTPDTGRFLRRNWWQIVFLALPFLRVLRLARAVRLLRSGRVLSSAVRSTRSTQRILTGRLGWLAAFWAIIVLTVSQLLYLYSDFDGYGAALHATALATIVGEPLGRPDGFALVLDVVLAIFSVVVFATTAASLGAFFLERRDGGREQPTGTAHVQPSNAVQVAAGAPKDRP